MHVVRAFAGSGSAAQGFWGLLGEGQFRGNPQKTTNAISAIDAISHDPDLDTTITEGWDNRDTCKCHPPLLG
jgi:hypothetical protein